MDEQLRLPRNFSKQMEPVVQYTEAVTHTMTKMTEEMSHFLNTRCQHLSEIANDLTQCQNPAKLMEINVRWFVTTMRDYTEEGNRMMSLMQEMVRPMKQGMQGGRERGLHPVGAE